MSIKYAMSHKIIILFILLCQNIFAETRPNMVMLVSSENKITGEFVGSKIISFSYDGNFYRSGEVIHSFGKYRDLERLELLPQKQFIIYENDMNDKVFIINTTNLKDIIKLDWAMKTTTSLDSKQLIQIVGDINGNSNVYSFDIKNFKKNIVNSKYWREALSNDCFYITDAVRYCGMGMNNEKFLPKPSDSFLNEGENLDCIVTKKLSELADDKIRYMVKSSHGENFIYFIWNKGGETTSLLWIYDIKNKAWSWQKLAADKLECYNFEDNFAVKHGYFLQGKLNENEVAYSGKWTVFLAGKANEIYLSKSSKILFLDSKRMIFSDMNRLYEVPIVGNCIALKQVKLIAESDMIRNVSAVFFEK